MLKTIKVKFNREEGQFKNPVALRNLGQGDDFDPSELWMQAYDATLGDGDKTTVLLFNDVAGNVVMGQDYKMIASSETAGGRAVYKQVSAPEPVA